MTEEWKEKRLEDTFNDLVSGFSDIFWEVNPIVYEYGWTVCLVMLVLVFSLIINLV